MTQATQGAVSANAAEIESLALVWHKKRSAGALSDLTEASLDYIEGTVASILNPIPNVVGQDDLMAAGAEGFLSATKTFDPEKGTFRTWSYRKIKGSALDLIKQMSSYYPDRGRYVQTVCYDDEDIAELPANGHSDPQDVLEDYLPENTSEVLREAMAALPHRQRNILVFLLNGLTPSQVARLLNSSPNYVHKERHLAVAVLSSALSDQVEVTVEAIMER